MPQTNIGDLTKFAKKVEKLFADEFCKGKKPGIAIAFTLPSEYKYVYWVTNVSKEDGINLFKETAAKMISQTN